MSTVLVGIDLSLTSPGLAIYIPLQQQVHVYFYAARKKDINREREMHCQWNNGTTFYLHPFSRQIVNKGLLERYAIITEDILREIKHHNVTRIRIEGYAFDAKSSSISKLHELGGILKYFLFQNERSWEEIPPSRLKKWFTGSGRATKELMYQTFINKNLPPLINIFEMEKCKGIPTPVQDIVDAFALVDSFFDHE